MWRKCGIFILIILFITISGCSQIGKSPASQTKPTVTPTPLPTAKYTRGDIVKSSPTDNTGIIIIDYDLKYGRYSVRTVIFDKFGRIYYIKNQGAQSVPFATIESSYPIKSGNVDNPFAVEELDFGQPKFGVGSIHRENEFENKGIIILSYDYFTDKYTFAYAFYEGGGKWNYDPEAKQSESRVKIEDLYPK